jgi:hypothetical protein
VPVIPNYSFDQAIAAVTDLVMERATSRAAELRARGEVPPDRPSGLPHEPELHTEPQPEPEPDTEREGKSA